MPGRGGWTDAGALVRAWRLREKPDRLAILSAVWEKEVGHFSRHWRLTGVRRGILYVSPSSPAANMELRLRGRDIVKGLNKYFKGAWIKGIRAAR